MTLFLLLRIALAADKYFNDELEYETTLNDDDFNRARFVTETLSVDDGDEAQMYSTARFEGDMANPGLNADTMNAFLTTGYETSAPAPDGVQMNAIRNQYLLWPSKRVPYTISSRYSSYRLLI